MNHWLHLALVAVPVLARGAAPLPAVFTPEGDTLVVRTAALSARMSGDRVDLAAEGQRVTIRWPNAAIRRLEPLDASGAHANFFRGANRGAWREAVPLYARAAYRGLYPGVDLIYAIEGNRLKSEYHLAAGTDPGMIRVMYEGGSRVAVEDDGALVVETPEGVFREEAPLLYQPRGAERLPVSGGFEIHGDGTIGFSVGTRDPSLPLVIDPPLAYSTYLGGSLTDRIQALTTDSTGNAYAAGFTESFNFPATPGSAQGSWAGSVDAFVAKLSPGGTLLWVTYLGGSGDDRGQSVAVDSTGAVYITGWTQSSNFPTVSAHRAFLLGARDAFVAKLNAAGSALVYSTYYGGTGSDAGHGIAVDTSGHAYVTGVTNSTNFPLVSALQATFGGVQDAFVAKFAPGGNTLVYSTYLGGSGDERGTGIAVHDGQAFVHGTTRSANFPTAAAYQVALSGTQDMFLARLNATGTAFVFSTLFGGPGVESAETGGSVKTDAAGHAYVVGTTTGTIPIVNGAQSSRPGGSADGFVARFQPNGGLAYSTYLGGSAADIATAVAVDLDGRAYVTGYTNSSNFPIVNASQPARGGDYDAFLTRLSASGSVIEESTYLGGAAVDAAYGVAVDGAGRVYTGGMTLSANFPTQNPAQANFGGTIDAFLAGFAPETTNVTPGSGGGAQQTFAVGYTNALGLADTKSLTFLVHTGTASLANSCAVQYELATNALRLLDDAGSAWLGPVTPGTSAVVANQQCHLAASDSSVVTSGNTITVHLALTFKPAFWGPKILFVETDRNSSGVSGWIQYGAWTASGPASGTVIVPSSGSGHQANLLVMHGHPSGASDLRALMVLLNSGVSTVKSCFVRYEPNTNVVLLLDDFAQAWAGSATVGTHTTLANSQCILNVAATTAVVSGTSVGLQLALTFKPGFMGVRNVYLETLTLGGSWSGMSQVGSWTAALPPAGTQVVPATGTGFRQTYTLIHHEAAGLSNLQAIMLFFQTTATASNSCFLRYEPNANNVLLLNDAGTGWAGVAKPGVSVTMQNSQCILDTGASSRQVSGNVVYLSLAVTFKPSFGGAKTIWTETLSTSLSWSGAVSRGSWTVAAPPAGNWLTPSAGISPSQVFGLLRTDPAGLASSAAVTWMAGASTAESNACQVRYNVATNTLQLLNDAGAAWVATQTPGAVGTQENSQCVLNSGASSRTVTGNTLVLHLAVTFKPAFHGVRNLYTRWLSATDVWSAWETRGIWVAASSASAPSVVPGSGIGSAQTFTFYSPVADGLAATQAAMPMFSASAAVAGSCYIRYEPASNTLRLLNDAATGWVGSATLGIGGSLQNTQCTLNTGSSSRSFVGNGLVLSLPVTFKPAFAGSKNTYLETLSVAGAWSGLQVLGTWIVP